MLVARTLRSLCIQSYPHEAAIARTIKSGTPMISPHFSIWRFRLSFSRAMQLLHIPLGRIASPGRTSTTKLSPHEVQVDS